jgi:stage II sporulation protein M
MFDGQMKTAILITIVIFFASLTAGWVGTSSNPAMGDEMMKIFEKDIASQLKGDNLYEMAVMLFANNLEACILLFLGGATCGILTVFILSLNGLVIGAIIEIVHHDHSPVFVATAILPHGIFEVPAFVIAGALGLCLAWSFVAEWKTGVADMAAYAQGYARLFILYVLPLVAVAACVEAFITPVVIHLVV